MMVLKAVPGIYIHSLLGSRNYHKGVEETGIKRMINRQKLPFHELESSLKDQTSLRHQVLENYLRLLDSRKRIRAFHPSGFRWVEDLDSRLISIERRYKGEKVMAIVNVSKDEIDLPQYEMRFDLITRTLFDGKIAPYGIYFLE